MRRATRINGKRVLDRTWRGRAAKCRPAFIVLDPLEARQLMSVVIASSGKTGTYTDVDGDLVTVAVSAGTLTNATFTSVGGGIGEQLEVIDLRDVGFVGTNLTVTVKRTVPTGDGLANIGYINASGNDLGAVSISGDLGRIDAGNATTATPGLKSLTVRSMGRAGLDSQGGTGNLDSHIVGALSSLAVKGDVQAASIDVSGGADGKIGAITIGGSLIGGAADHSGEIHSTGDMGTIKVAGDVQGFGGSFSGSIVVSAGAMGAVTVGGSIVGSSGASSGQLSAQGNIKSVSVGGDLRGRSGAASGAIISTAGSILATTIGGSLLGGSGTGSGEVVSAAAIGDVKITRNLAGGSGGNSGFLAANNGSIGNVSIGGSILGGSGGGTGSIFAGQNAGLITIKHDVHGADGGLSGCLLITGALKGLSIGGSLLGSSGDDSGMILLHQTAGNITIGGDVHGGSGFTSGYLEIFGTAAAVTVGGSVVGSSGAKSGEIEGQVAMGAVKIGGDLRGGSGTDSGLVLSDAGSIAGVAVGGVILGGSANRSGAVQSGGNLGVVAVGSSLIGGSVSGTSSLDSAGSIISGGRITSVTIGGSIVAGALTGTGTLTKSGAIIAGNDIGSITVKGSLIGNENATGNTFVTISARGQAVQGATTDVAIGKITIGGRVQFADIFAGYDMSLLASNADAQIGSVTVGGDWVASNIVAGAKNTGPASTFGDGNDVPIFPAGDTRNKAVIHSLISSVTIKGFVFGTPAATNDTDHFGFVAESVAAVSLGGIKLPLSALVDADLRVIPGTTDVTVLEV